MHIKSVINNNFLCVVDDKGRELVVSGRGLGFQRKRGEVIDPARVEKVYQMQDKASRKKLVELVDEIPAEHLEMTQELIEKVKGQLTYPLNESLLITLADHVSFAIKRAKEGLLFQSPLTSSVMSYYPQEYHLGKECIRMIGERFDCHLPDDEAAIIALHIVNAELNTNMSQVYDITTLIEDAIQIVEHYYQRTFDRTSLNFDRFCVHLRFFGQRLFSGKTLTDTQDEHDIMFRQLIARNSKEHYKCAQCIAELVKNKYQKELSEEELIYLTIHLRRINSAD